MILINIDWHVDNISPISYNNKVSLTGADSCQSFTVRHRSNVIESLWN
ncbi:hypothetical protein SSM2_087 [Synechococcus phage S-SM2]|uniref:Uncharacterized protein n=1 Tax=Synechococcus phage S-SM2 TaxID=444860 RepID=E3SIY1_9CAUD|nr:hypothetical protein SSM2_087 [Synechococcus phage S-SM2]ADO97429.1 hypothetical protein SSM2_087 [Synechococcus phage S-SM2]